MDIKDKIRITLDGERVYENKVEDYNSSGYQLKYFNGEYGIVYDKNNYNYRLIGSNGYFVNDIKYKMLKHVGDGLFIFDDNWREGIINNGKVTFKVARNHTLKYIDKGIFSVYYFEDSLVNKDGKILVDSVRYNECLVDDERIFYRDNSGYIGIKEKNGDEIFRKYYGKLGKLILFNDSFCLIEHIVEGKTIYVKYVYNSDERIPMEITNIRKLKNNKYLVEYLNSTYDVVDNNLDSIDNEIEYHKMFDSFNDLYNSLLYSRDKYQVILDDCGNAGLMWYGDNPITCLQSIFKSIVISDGYVIVEDKYAIPLDRTNDIKIEFVLEINDGNNKYERNFDSRSKQKLVLSEMKKELKRIDDIYQDKRIKLEEEYKNNLSNLMNQKEEDKNNLVKRLILKRKEDTNE